MRLIQSETQWKYKFNIKKEKKNKFLIYTVHIDLISLSDISLNFYAFFVAADGSVNFFSEFMSARTSYFTVFYSFFVFFIFLAGTLSVAYVAHL